MAFKHFLLGLFVKGVTGFGDTITHIPILASVTKTKMGRVAFSLGTLMAIILAIVLALGFSTLIRGFIYYRYLAAGLVFLLALAIHFDLFVHKPREKAEKKLVQVKRMSVERFTKLMGVGFVASFATVIDDIIAYAPVLAAGGKLSVVLGIILATVIEIILVIYFARKISRLKYTDEIASLGLVVLGVLILAGVV